MIKVEKETKTIWNLSAFFFFVVALLAIRLLYYFFSEYELATKLAFLAYLWFGFSFLKKLILNHFAFKNKGYKIDTEVFYLRCGGFSVSETMIPIVRIQHIEIEQTFLSRFYNLYSLTIHTAGDYHTLEFIKKETAYELKEKLLYLLDEVDENE